MVLVNRGAGNHRTDGLEEQDTRSQAPFDGGVGQPGIAAFRNFRCSLLLTRDSGSVWYVPL